MSTLGVSVPYLILSSSHMVWYLLIPLALSNVMCDQFVAHDCSDPTSVEHIPHHTCRIPTGTLGKEEYSILQERKIKPVDG